jgi:hypothetical protein
MQSADSPLNRAPTCSSMQIVLSQHRHRVSYIVFLLAAAYGMLRRQTMALQKRAVLHWKCWSRRVSIPEVVRVGIDGANIIKN